MAVRVLLDGQRVRLEPSANMILGQVLDVVQGQLHGSGHTIRSVSLDGTEVPLWAEETTRSLERVTEVHVITIPVSELLSETAESALAYVRSLEAGIGDAAQRFLAGNDEQGSQILGQVAEGLDWYLTFLADMARLGYGGGQDAAERARAVSDSLHGVVAAWEDQDYGLLADLLQYELVPVLAEARDWLERWLKRQDG